MERAFGIFCGGEAVEKLLPRVKIVYNVNGLFSLPVDLPPLAW